ncbi:MAG TPA: helix-turn-helix domain-containing protein [Actinomycetota bacterium]|jgi:DNA-binding transcriptional ArsR family regulator|nr:helix-turn-helix domain-containing protein [Actinomycetota bacterium]
MTHLGDDVATRTAKVLSLPTRAAILALLLRTGPKTVKEIADSFHIHPNVARAHLDLMVDAGFLATETRRGSKGRPAKVYFTWEGEAAALSEAGVDVPALSEREGKAAQQEGFSELEVELRLLERLLGDAMGQLRKVRELMDEARRNEGGLYG